MAGVPSGRFALQLGGTRVHQVHVQRVTRDGLATQAPPLLPGEIELPLMPQVVAGWQSLLETEFESVVVAGWMTSALARLGAPLDLLGAFGRVVEDEVRHVDVVAQVLTALGVAPTLPRDVTPPVMAWKDDAQSDEQVVAGLVSFFCVGELVSALEFRQALTLVTLPLAQWALAEIHRDEAFHGAFGFEAAQLFVPTWSEAQKARLVTRVTVDLAQLERRMGGPLTGPARELTSQERRMAQLGLPPPQLMLAVLYDAVEQQLAPRLARLGIELGVRLGLAR